MNSHNLRIVMVSLLGMVLTPSGLGQARTYQPVGVIPSPSVNPSPQVNGPLTAVPTQQSTPTLQVRPTTPSLLIGRGDNLQIYVYNEPDMAQTVVVDDAGDVPLLMGGAVHIAGLSPENAATAISNHLRDAQIMRSARVTVTILSYGTQAVSVLGEVTRPGTVLVTTPRRILDIISLSGGFTSISDRLHVTVQHGSDPRNSQTVTLLNDPSLSLAGNNIMVNPGDTVIVPRAPVVYVLGNVQHPGAYVMQYDSEMTAMQAIAFAGGDLPDSKRGGIHVVRKTEGVSHELKIPLDQIEKGKTPDVQLVADDVLYVPFSFPKHWVMGGASLAISGASTLVYAVR